MADETENLKKPFVVFYRKEIFALLIISLLFVAATAFFFVSAFTAHNSEYLDIEKFPSDKRIYKLRIELNSAPAELFELLPGVGAKTAQRIVEYREKIGGFKTIEQLQKVKGINKIMLERIRPYVYIARPQTAPN